MDKLTPIDLADLVAAVTAEGKGRRVIWQDSESMAFLSSGRKGRRDFHTDPSDEITLQLSGRQQLVYLLPDGKQQTAVLEAGQMLLCPAGVPHSPRVDDGSWFIVFERRRKPGEQDRFLWLCESCNAKVYETAVEVGDYHQDPVAAVHRKFYGDEKLRTCRRCGTVVPVPPP